jgi:septum formation topological specificity factor MinE
MHLLIRYPILLLAIFFITGCSSGGPLTPAASFLTVRSALEKNDIKKIGEIISSDTREKINHFLNILSTLDNDQIAVIAKFYNIESDKLRNIGFYGALSLHFNPGAKLNLRDIFKEDMVTMDIIDNEAVIRTESGYELDFVREGPYWKLDLSEL